MLLCGGRELTFGETAWVKVEWLRHLSELCACLSTRERAPTTPASAHLYWVTSCQLVGHSCCGRASSTIQANVLPAWPCWEVSFWQGGADTPDENRAGLAFHSLCLLLKKYLVIELRVISYFDYVMECSFPRFCRRQRIQSLCRSLLFPLLTYQVSGWTSHSTLINHITKCFRTKRKIS